MWEGRVWHGQGASISSQDRVAVIMTFVMHMVRAQDNYAALLHDDVYAGLSDQEKRLLGFEVHFDYAGRIAPRHSVDPRRNTNYVFPYVPELRRGSDARAVPRTGMRIAHTEVQAEIV
jgi:ectoine hydroxylase-related dioxygenase (phytanoyl-CoA dioxygenase family)